MEMLMPIHSTLPFAERRKVALIVSDVTTGIALPAPLTAAVDGAIAEAFSRVFFDDPLFGEDLTAIRAPLDSICRRHGILIEQAIAHALSVHDRYDVQSQVAVPISQAALDLCDSNAPSATERITIPASGQIRTTVLDLVVYDRLDQRLILASVKRGGGFQGGGAARLAHLEQRAAASVLRSLVAGQGISVRGVEVIVIDWYGRTGISGGRVVTGPQVDDFFGVPVTPIVDAMTERLRLGVRERARTILGRLVSSAGLRNQDLAVAQPSEAPTRAPAPSAGRVVIDLSQCLAGLPRRRRGRPMRAIRADD
jgi:hypothetical protein